MRKAFAPCWTSETTEPPSPTIFSFTYPWGDYNLAYNPNPTPAKGEQKPTPDIGGPSLGPSQTRTYEISTGNNEWLLKLPAANIPGFGLFQPGGNDYQIV
jgi:hypothetical protein